jgi:hypothetical protein
VRKVEAAAVAVGLGGAVAATVAMVALDDDEPEVLQAPPGEVVEIDDDDLDTATDAPESGPVAMNPDRPFVCLVDLDCLLHEVEVAAGIRPAAG